MSWFKNLIPNKVKECFASAGNGEALPPTYNSEAIDCIKEYYSISKDRIDSSSDALKALRELALALENTSPTIDDLKIMNQGYEIVNNFSLPRPFGMHLNIREQASKMAEIAGKELEKLGEISTLSQGLASNFVNGDGACAVKRLMDEMDKYPDDPKIEIVEKLLSDTLTSIALIADGVRPSDEQLRIITNTSDIITEKFGLDAPAGDWQQEKPKLMTLAYEVRNIHMPAIENLACNLLSSYSQDNEINAPSNEI